MYKFSSDRIVWGCCCITMSILFIYVIVTINYGAWHNNNINTTCNISEDLRREIAGYSSIVNKIVRTVKDQRGKFKGKTWSELAYFVDTFGNRIAGSDNLENAIDYMTNLLRSIGLDNVHGENVTTPHWVRGKESAILTSPKMLPLKILGLGYSVGTPTSGLHGDVLVVQSFDELRSRSSEVEGKIVVIAEDWLGSYGKTVQYRSRAAIEVAKVGGLAALIRSVTPFSIASPHTGMMHYEDGVPKIPVAALTVEDAEMLLRMSRRGTSLKMSLYMGAHMLNDTVSRNTIAELIGTTYPDKVVIVSGHLDSWDVGMGAMDDGGGAFISWNALALLKSLDLRPKRTIRAVLWTAEEMGLIGASAYAEAHKSEVDNFIVMMESDEGTFTPLGLEYMGSDEGGCIIQEILKLMEPINATQFKNSSDVGSDIMVWSNKVPLLSNLNSNERYFWFHHSAGDTMSVMDPSDLDSNTALWAAAAYIIADMSVDLPKPTSTEH